MGDDRTQARKMKPVKGLIHRRRDGEIREFDKQIVFLVEREARWIVFDVTKIFKAEMKVTAGRENQAAFDRGLEFIAALLYQFGNEGMVR